MPDGNTLIIGQANTASNPGVETSLDRNEATPNTVFVARNLNRGAGIRGTANGGTSGFSTNYAYGVWGETSDGTGVLGTTNGGGYGVAGRNLSGSNAGVHGSNSGSGEGVEGHSDSGDGVYGFSWGGNGVRGYSPRGPGVTGESGPHHGVRGFSTTATGVYGSSPAGIGVYGESSGGYPAVQARSFGDGFAIWAEGARRAALFSGTDLAETVIIIGGLAVYGHIFKEGGGFRIDHPLDAGNKYLQHSFVESPDMKNVYDGVEQLDEDGTAWVELPEYFGELNRDYRYQLTALGGPAPDLHVAEEIYENRFKIAGGREGMKVSWQVTGVRKDEWAEANRIAVELEKSEEQKQRVMGPTGKAQPPQPSAMPPQPPELPPRSPQPLAMPPSLDFGSLEEQHRRQIDYLRRQIEELRRRVEGQEERPGAT